MTASRNKQEKPPSGYKVRLGAYIGHGKRIVHIPTPDGFYFQWEMSEGFGSDARRDTIEKLRQIANLT